MPITNLFLYYTYFYAFAFEVAPRPVTTPKFCLHFVSLPYLCHVLLLFNEPNPYHKAAFSIHSADPQIPSLSIPKHVVMATTFTLLLAN